MVYGRFHYEDNKIEILKSEILGKYCKYATIPSLCKNCDSFGLFTTENLTGFHNCMDGRRCIQCHIVPRSLCVRTRNVSAALLENGPTSAHNNT